MTHYVMEMLSFAAVAEQGGFTAAARKLTLSKGLISQHVKRLEEALGAQLLFRSTRRIELTEAGARFLPYCQRIIGTVQTAFEDVSALHARPEGLVRMTVPISFGEVFLHEILTQFQTIHPGITIELEMENKFQDMKSAKLDIAIRKGLTEDPDQVALPIGQFSEHICAAPRYWETRSKPRTPLDLADHPCILNFHLHKLGEWIFYADADPIAVKVTGPIRLNHYPLIRDAAISGLGVALLPRYILEPELQKGRLELALTNYKTPTSPIYIVYPYQGHLPLKNRLLIDFIRDWFQSRPALLAPMGVGS
jgi:DNA-binding transcriptional LysR family regulator